MEFAWLIFPLNSSLAQSYDTSPLDAAVEIVWFNKIVVVVSAGNNGSSTLYPPANDPFVITVGATNDHGTVDTSDDTLATFSAHGTTESGTRQTRPGYTGTPDHWLAASE